jgi:hypothetical protein
VRQVARGIYPATTTMAAAPRPSLAAEHGLATSPASLQAPDIVVELSDLPEEILLAILERLPANALALSRCICAPWRGLVPTVVRRALAHYPRATRVHAAAMALHDGAGLVVRRDERAGRDLHALRVLCWLESEWKRKVSRLRARVELQQCEAKMSVNICMCEAKIAEIEAVVAHRRSQPQRWRATQWMICIRDLFCGEPTYEESWDEEDAWTRRNRLRAQRA